jgi:hypothetical protein
VCGYGKLNTFKIKISLNPVVTISMCRYYSRLLALWPLAHLPSEIIEDIAKVVRSIVQLLSSVLCPLNDSLRAGGILLDGLSHIICAVTLAKLRAERLADVRKSWLIIRLHI